MKLSPSKRLHELCRDGLVQDSTDMFDSIHKSGIIPKVVTNTTVLQGFFHDQKLNDATRVFKKIMSNVVVPNAFSCGILIQRLCKGKRLDDALRFCL